MSSATSSPARPCLWKWLALAFSEVALSLSCWAWLGWVLLTGVRLGELVRIGLKRSLLFILPHPLPLRVLVSVTPVPAWALFSLHSLHMHSSAFIPFFLWVPSPSACSRCWFCVCLAHRGRGSSWVRRLEEGRCWGGLSCRPSLLPELLAAVMLTGTRK